VNRMILAKAISASQSLVRQAQRKELSPPGVRMQLVPPHWLVGLQHILRGSDDLWFIRLAGLAVAGLRNRISAITVSFHVAGDSANAADRLP
jgi:hypothetical protein